MSETAKIIETNNNEETNKMVNKIELIQKNNRELN